MRVDKALRNFVSTRDPPFFRKTGKKPVSHERLLQAIEKGELFGLGCISVTVPASWPFGAVVQHALPPRRFFEQFCPIFQNRMVGFHDVGPFMQRHVIKTQMSEKISHVLAKHSRRAALEGRMVDCKLLAQDVRRIKFVTPPPRRMLISTLSSEKLVVTSPLIQWYVRNGLEVRVLHFIEYTPARCFGEFVKGVTRARQTGGALQALNSKIIGNAAYGGLLLRKSNHTKVRHVRSDKGCEAYVNDPNFKKLTHIGADCYEIESLHPTYKMDLPTVLGISVLSDAKLIMLQFYYDFWMRYFPVSCHRPLLTDTDSLYFALASRELESMVYPERLAEYRHRIKGQHGVACATPCANDVEGVGYLVRECCPTHRQMDSKTPHFFKIECSGSASISLSSKTYICKGDTDGQTSKFSCKGLQRRRLNIARLWQTYMNVFTSRRSDGANNISFRVFSDGVYTYQQRKLGLSWSYHKRIVLSDGSRTLPLFTK